MSSIAGHDLKEQVRASIDIVELIGSSLDLRREGQHFTGLCPWHDDSKPSLKVNPARQSWRCWVCAVGGDIFDFTMRREGVNFRESLELLAERAGIEVRPSGKRQEEGTAGHKPTLYRAMAWAEQQYHDCLLKDPVADEARQYLADRGIQEQSIRDFRLGFAPGGWDWLLGRSRSTPFDQKVLQAVGLLVHNEQSNRRYDRYRERVIFPIRDTQDRSIGLGGRVLPGSDDPAKYINSPETRLFAKSDNLYGLDRAREAVMADRHAVIVEGYTDVIMAHQYGLSNVVAVLGTALGPRHIRLLRRFADRVTLVLDGDEAGQRRTNEVLELFVASPLDLCVVALPDGKDPCDFVQQQGADAFRKLVSDADDALTFKINLATQSATSGSVHQDSRLLDEILKTVSAASLNDQDISNPWRLRMEQTLGRLARMFRIDDSQIRLRLRQLRKSKRALSSSHDDTTQVEPTVLHGWDRELLWLLLKCPELSEQAIEYISEDQLRSADAVGLWRVIVSVFQRGDVPEFQNVLSEIDDSRLRNILVEVDEAKVQPPTQPQACLEQLIESYRSRDSKGMVRNQVAELENSQLSEGEQIDALEKILSEMREQQGISAPTDG